MKIYTRQGDRGKTSLLGGSVRVSKTDPQVAAYGTVDGLNSQLGFVASLLTKKQKTLAQHILKIQEDLWEVEAELSTPSGQEPPFKTDENKTKRLERLIDEETSHLPPLENFIFPGGSQAAAALHVARTVCRRAERVVVRLSEKQKVNEHILSYVNRLSDALFTLARVANQKEGVEEKVWKGK